MANVGEYKLSWKRSATEGVTRQLVKITNDGAASVMELTPDVQTLDVLVAAGKDFSFVVQSIRDFVATDSVADSFTVPDLTPPEPATDLTHELTGVHDAGTV